MGAAAAAGAAGVLWCPRRSPAARRWPPRRPVAADLPDAVDIAAGPDAAGGRARAPAAGAGHRARGAQRLGGRRAGHRPGDPGGRGRRATGWSCCAARAAGPPPNCCPASTRSSSWPLPWIDARRPAGRPGRACAALTDGWPRVGADEAVIFTSFHQSPLPLALLLRMAGVPRISAISDDYPGSLLDVPGHRRPGRRTRTRARRSPSPRRRRLSPLPDRRRTVPAAAARRPVPPSRPPPVRAGLRRGAPGCLGAGPGLPGRAGHAGCVGALARRRAPGGGHRRAGERELTATGRRRPAALDLGGRTGLAGAGRACSPAPARWWSATPGPRTWPPRSARRWSACSPRPSRSASGGRTGCRPCGSATPAPACRDTRAARCPVPGHPCLAGDVDAGAVVAPERSDRAPTPASPVPSSGSRRPRGWTG